VDEIYTLTYIFIGLDIYVILITIYFIYKINKIMKGEW